MLAEKASSVNCDAPLSPKSLCWWSASSLRLGKGLSGGVFLGELAV
jgi:hypothetical protein